MIGGLIPCNMHPIGSQCDSISRLISAGSDSFLSEATGVFTHLPVDAKCPGTQMRGVKLSAWANNMEKCISHISRRTRRRRRIRPHGAVGNKSREQKGGKLSKGGENLSSFNSPGLVRYGYAYCRHRREGSLHQHASEHHDAWAMIRIVHWIIAYSAVMCIDDAWWMNWR